MKNFLTLCLIFTSYLLTSQVNIILNDNSKDPPDNIKTYLETNTGASVAVVTFSAANIGSADQIWIITPVTDFEPNVINALIQALDDGKRIVLVAEWQGYASIENARLNNIATHLGLLSQYSDMFVTTAFGCIPREVFVQDHPLTEGVTSPMGFSATSSEIIMGDNALSLIKYEEPAAVLHDIAIVECVSNGDVVMIGDTNWFTCVYFNPVTIPQSNIDFFSHVVNSPSGCASEPTSEPIPTLSQWGLIMLGLCLSVMGIVALRQRNLTFT